MLSVMMLALFDAPNDFWLGLSSIVGTLVGIVLVRLVYVGAKHEREGASEFARVVERGARLLKALTAVMAVVAVPLLWRFGTPVDGEFFAAEAVNRRWWAVWRVVVAVLLGGSTTLFESHPLVRLTVLMFMPFIAATDMLSEIQFASEIACIDDGVCAAADSYRNDLENFAVRDLVSTFLCLAISVVALWLTSFFGFCANHVSYARKEHIEFRLLGPAQLADTYTPVAPASPA